MQHEAEISDAILDDLPSMKNILNDVLFNGKKLRTKEQIDADIFKEWLNSPKENIGDHFA